MEGMVPEPEQQRLFEFNRSDRDFLRNAGIRGCVIRCFPPRSHAVALIKEHPLRITEEDTKWLRECGVAWEPKPAVQLSLDFTGCQETVQET
jgi:hypothetical protein